jgi:fido (protein-threonine AMPylation protein)
MLDRSQHLRLFLLGSGDSQEDTAAVLSNIEVRKELNFHPINSERLLRAIREASQFELDARQRDTFRALFGRYR